MCWGKSHENHRAKSNGNHMGLRVGEITMKSLSENNIESTWLWKSMRFQYELGMSSNLEKTDD
jgi:hypothetical protein